MHFESGLDILHFLSDVFAAALSAFRLVATACLAWNVSNSSCDLGFKGFTLRDLSVKGSRATNVKSAAMTGSDA